MMEKDLELFKVDRGNKRSQTLSSARLFNVG